MEFDPAVRSYYDKGDEAARLGGASLERVRTQELLERFLPGGPLEILDVGGGPGIYAAWLAERGHRVLLVDPIPLHAQQAAAAHPDVIAEVGDARQLAQDNASFDVVLLLGPLYHLIERDERLVALREAKRVLRPGGLLFAAAISRFAALLDLLVNHDRLHEPEIGRLVEESVRTGVFRGSGEGGLFTTGYFHLPGEFSAEIAEAGFGEVEIFNLEGPGFFVADLESRWDDPDRREALLRAARLVEQEPAMLGSSSHLLAVACG